MHNNKEIEFCVDKICLFTKLAKSLSVVDNRRCLENIEFFTKKLQNLLLVEERAVYNQQKQLIEIPKEIVLIFENGTGLESYIQDVLERVSIEFYSFSSLEEYNDIFDEIESERLILISNKIIKNSFDKIKRIENSRIIKIEKSDNFTYDFIDIKTMEKIDVLRSILTNKKIKFRKFKYLNILLIGENNLELKFLSEIFLLMNIEFNIARDEDKAVELLKEKTFNIILISERNKIDFLNKTKMSKDTLKISVDNLDIWDIDRLLYKYFLTYSDEKNTEKIEIGKQTEHYEIFITHLDDSISSLQKELDNKNYIEIKKIVHNLKSSASVLKEIKILSILHAIDDNAEKENNFILIEKLDKLEREKDKIEIKLNIQL